MTSPAGLGDDWPIVVPSEDLGIRPPGHPEGRLRRWSSVFVLNLPICLSFGYGSTAGFGRLGMGLGIVILFGIGWGLTRRWRPIGVDLTIGGIEVALTQFLPIAQIWSGAVGLSVGAWMADTTVGAPVSGPGLGFGVALIATLVTGGILITVALLLGLFSRLFTPKHRRHGPESYEIKPKRLDPADLRDFHRVSRE